MNGLRNGSNNPYPGILEKVQNAGPSPSAFFREKFRPEHCTNLYMFLCFGFFSGKRARWWSQPMAYMVSTNDILAYSIKSISEISYRPQINQSYEKNVTDPNFSKISAWSDLKVWEALGDFDVLRHFMVPWFHFMVPCGGDSTLKLAW